MKKIIYSLAILLASSALCAQQNIQLNINNYLGSKTYAKNTSSNNSLGHEFNITRLEYYISQIILIHDGGMMDTFESTYLLVNPSGSIDSFDLGQKSFTNLEAIQFAIGVEAPTNNEDPTQYPTGHPLAPKSPSMHWGWSSGYRFIAIEGKCGFGLNQTYQLHGLWNANYFSLRIPVTGKYINNKTVITLNADYDQILNDIDMSSGVIAHGTDDQDLDALKNMRDSVFSNVNGETDILSSPKMTNSIKYSIYPNPIKLNENINLGALNSKVEEIQVFNSSGRLIQKTQNVNNIKFTHTGMYILSIKDIDGVVHTSKLIAVN